MLFSPCLAFLSLETQFMLLLFNLQSPIFLTYPHVAGFTTFRCHSENHFSLKLSLSMCGSCQAEGKTYTCRLKKGNSKQPGTKFIARQRGPNGGILCVGLHLSAHEAQVGHLSLLIGRHGRWNQFIGPIYEHKHHREGRCMGRILGGKRN